MIAFEVTVEITLPLVGAEIPTREAADALVHSLALVVVEAAGLPVDSDVAKALVEGLASGDPMRVRISPLALARFFVLRRGTRSGVHRLHWKDAVEVDVPA